jgi:hypothetical protein
VNAPASAAPPRRGAGVAVAAWLLLALFCLRDFGPVWDSPELRFGDQLLGFCADPAAAGFDPLLAAPLHHRAPAPAFGDDFAWSQSTLVSTALSAWSCWLCCDVLGVLPAMAGYLVATVLLVAAMALAVARFGERRVGGGAGLLAVGLLLTMPRFATEALGNFKDAPECALFAFAALAAFAALRTGTARAWLAFAAAAGAAAAQKPNGLFLPLLPLPFLVAAWCGRGGPFRAPRWWVLPAAAVAAAATLVALLPQVWPHPVDRLRERFTSLMALGNSLASGAMAQSGPHDGISAQSLWMVFATTPVTILLAASAGTLARSAPQGVRQFLLAWLALPLLRTLLPGMRHYNGIRHFLEFVVPLALLAAIGIAALARTARARGGVGRWLAAAVVLAPFAECGYGLAQAYPYGNCWFSPLVGGLRGQQQRGDPDATDYWCSSYWAAAAWLTQHASAGAWVICPVGEHVLRAIAPVRLRPDLCLGEPPAAAGADAYVVYATKRAYWPRWLQDARAVREPEFRLAVQGGTILEILELDAVRDAPARAAALTQRRAEAMSAAVAAELVRDRPQVLGRLWEIVSTASARDEAASVALLRELLPARSDDDLRLLLWPYRPR